VYTLRTFLALAVAHILSDFPLQTDRMVAQKQEIAKPSDVGMIGRSVGYVKHAAIVFVVSILMVPFLTSTPWSRRLVEAVLTIAALHILLDYLKCRFVPQSNLSVLLVDQGLHLALIFGVLASFGMVQWNLKNEFVFLFGPLRDRFAIVVSGYVISIWVGGIVIRLLLSSTGGNRSNAGDSPRAGIRIGQLERFLVTTLTVLSQYNAIAFVFAAKSIARFKRLEEEPTFAEYYLTGTLASVSFGVLVGLGIKGALYLLHNGG